MFRQLRELQRNAATLLPRLALTAAAGVHVGAAINRNRIDGEELAKRGQGAVTPYERAILAALRELTGRDTAPTAAAWRTLLNSTQCE